MDQWAPVVRHANMGTGQLTNDSNSLSTAFGPFTPGSGSGAECAAHGSAGDKWRNAYGELYVLALTAAGARAGEWLRVADSSNYYSAYMTTTTAGIDSVVAGVSTNLLSTSVTLGSMPGVFRAEINDDMISVFWRGVFVGSARDSSLTAPGFVSMYLRANSSSLEAQATRFEAGPLSESTRQAGPPVRRHRLTRNI